MRTPRRASGQWVVAMLSIVGVAAADSARADQSKPPQVEIGETSVIVHEVPQGHSALLFGFGQDVQHHAMTLRRWEAILEHKTGDDLRFELDRLVPFLSVWLAVDLDTGVVGVAAPEGMSLRELPPAAQRANVTAATIDLPLQMAELVLVRPGGHPEAWGIRVGDGGDSDVDGQSDGVIRVEIDEMWSVGESGPAPDGLQNGDVILAIDAQGLGYSTTTIGSKGGEL